MKSSLPLILFVCLCALFLLTLGKNPRELPSPLVGKPAPELALPRLADPARTIKTADFLGEPWILNVWASWCAECLREHPLLTELLRDKAPLVGMNYKDRGADARAWLRQHGDPYVLSLADLDGAAGLEWGVYGAPETFIIDAAGVIRHKHVGPLSRDDIVNTLAPLLAELKKAAAGE